MSAEHSGELTSPGSPLTPKPRRRRWPRRLLSLLVLLGVAAWFAPTVVARTGLRNRVARLALADLRGTVDVGGVSLGWLSPVELRDVTVTDPAGRRVLSAPKVTSSKTLLAILWDRANPGEFALERPTTEVVCAGQGSNLEDTLAEYLKPDPQAGPTRTAVTVRVTGGKLLVRDTDTGTAWEFDPVDAEVAVPRDRAEPVRVTVAAAGPGTSRFEADLALGGSGEAKARVSGFPLEALAPVVRRLDPGTAAAGQLSADLAVGWGPDGAGRPTLRIDGFASARDLDASGPWLKGDRLRLTSAELPVKLEAVGRTVRIERAELKCDAGTLSAAGTFSPDDSPDKLLANSGVTVEADVDLAKLARLLPRLLRVREGTEVREGRLTVKLGSRATPAGTIWDGDVQAAALKATRGGRELAWEQPLDIRFSGRVPPGQLPTFDTFVCRSDVLAVNAQGSPDSFRAAANVYLDRLSERLAEFVDLGGQRLAGEASVWVVAGRQPDGRFQADGGAKLAGLVFADGTGRGLRERELDLRFSAAGRLAPDSPVRVETGSVHLTAGGDTLELALLEPVADVRRFSTGKLSARLAGDLGRWRTRVAGFVRVPSHYAFGGNTTASGTVRLEPGRVRVDGLTVAVANARFRGAGLDLDEPQVQGTADLTADRATGAVVLANLRISSPVLSVTDGSLAFEPHLKDSLAVHGGGQAVTDLDRLARTLRLQPDPNAPDAVHGRGTGPVWFRWQGDTTTFEGSLDVAGFAYGPRGKPAWAEPTLKLAAAGRYDETPDVLTLTRGRVERPGLVVEGKGTWSKFDTTQDVAVEGHIAYYLGALEPELRKWLGEGFHAAGHGQKPFRIAGSMAPQPVPGRPPTPLGTLTAEAGVGWHSLGWNGFAAGPGELTARLSGGVLHFSPIRASFAGAPLTVTPSVRLDPPPGELSVAKGKLVDRAKLTPEACAGALGYALPAVAKATRAEGEVSVVLDENRVPLDDFAKASARGQVVVHKATVGPGPVVSEITKLLGTPNPTVTLASEMAVPVRVENGRVYHENLSLAVNGFVVRTAGSVGFDGSLALVADVPVPVSPLKGNPHLTKALGGKSVKVPVTGTLDRPVVDPRQFRAAVGQLAQDAVKSLGKDLLNRELDKLLPAMPAPPKK